MTQIKLQYSILCQRDEKNDFKNLIHGFRPGMFSFYVTNKWVWDTDDMQEDGFLQVTEVLENSEVIAVSKSDLFNVKLSHTHHNYFQDICFKREHEYRVRVTLFDRQGQKVESGSLEYPVFVK